MDYIENKMHSFKQSLGKCIFFKNCSKQNNVKVYYTYLVSFLRYDFSKVSGALQLLDGTFYFKVQFCKYFLK